MSPTSYQTALPRGALGKGTLGRREGMSNGGLMNCDSSLGASSDVEQRRPVRRDQGLEAAGAIRGRRQGLAGQGHRMLVPSDGHGLLPTRPKEIDHPLLARFA